IAHVVRLSGESRNFRYCHAADCFSALPLLTMNSSPPLTSTPPFLGPDDGKGATPSPTSGALPPERTDWMVPSAALVSNAMAWDPLWIPSRLSNVPVPRSGLVVARPSFTMPESQEKIWRPVLSSYPVLVARALRP